MKRLKGAWSLGATLIGFVFSLDTLAGQPIASVGFIDQAGQEQRQVPVTFGQVFVPGEVMDGSRLIIQIGNTELPTQVNVKAAHPDGSVRHAILSTRLPVVPANTEVSGEIALSDTTGAGGTGITAQQLLDSGFDAEIRIVLDGVEYVASARKALQNGGKIWLDGPIATEFVLKAPFETADGTTHPHLTGRFDLRAYAGLDSVRVDAIVENNWTYVPGPRNFTYDVRVLVGGQEVYNLPSLTHYHRARWHKVFWWGKEPKVVVRHDTRYLQKTRAIPHYDPNVQVSERALDEVISRRYEPMANVWINDYMREGGADRGIAPLPWWQALHIVSGGDPRAYQAVLDNADAGGSYSSHLRDINTDLPVSLDDYPYVTGDRRQYPADQVIALCDTDCDTPLTYDQAHQPAIAYYPYLLTGDHYYLEELIFWANINMISVSLGRREYDKGLFWNQQVRGQAWTLRTLAQAAYILPDDHPFKSYFHEKLQNNIDYYIALYPDNPDGNKLGALAHHTELSTSAPWMDDFFTWAVGYTAELGFENIRPLFEWKAKYPISRLTSPDDEYCWIFAAPYQLAIGLPPTPGEPYDRYDPAFWYQSLAEAYLATFGNKQNSAGKYVKDMACGGQEMADWLTEYYGNRYIPGEMVGYSNNPMGYPANMQPAVAVTVDAGYPKADLAWDRLYNRVKFPDYSHDPQFAITPRSLNPSYKVPVIEDFTASSTTVDAGQTVTLDWSVSEAESCMASGDWNGEQAVSGQFITAALEQDAVFTLSCRNANGVATRSILVSVSEPPVTTEPPPPTQEPVDADGQDQPVENGDAVTTEDDNPSIPSDNTGETNHSELDGLNTDTDTVITPSRSIAGGTGATGPLGLGMIALLGFWYRRRSAMRGDTMNAKKKCALSVVMAGILAGSAQAAEIGTYLHYDFDQTSGDQILDASGNALAGTSRNTPVLEPGQVGQAMRFDHLANDQITRAIEGFPNREFTVSLWLKDARGDGKGSLFYFKSAGWEDRYFSFGEMDDLGIYLGNTFIKTGVRLDDGQWHHLVISWTRRNGHLRVYKDGVLAFEAYDVNRARNLPSSGTLSVGVEPNKWSTDWGNAFGGLMDELRIFHRRLSDVEIEQMASLAPVTDQTPPSVPGTPTAVAVSPSETYVAWDPASDDDGVAGYRLYRNGELIATTGDTIFIDRDLTPGATVTYTVQAFDITDRLSPLSNGGQVTLPASGSVLDVLPPGHWYEVVDSSIEVDLGKTPQVMEPWSGGAYDSLRDRLVIFGGGHQNYDGNELYAFDVNTLEWLQLTQPTAPENILRGTIAYADGRPTSVHSYDGLAYLPNVDRFFTSGGSIFGPGSCSGGTWLYDFDAQPAESGWQLMPESQGGCGMISAYDSATGHVWYGNGDDLYEFDPLNLEAPWTKHPGVFAGVFHFYMTAAVDPNRRKLAAVGGTAYGGYPKLLVVDLAADPIPKAEILATTGATEIEDTNAAGFVFDPVSDRFIAWDRGASVYALDVDAKVWSRLDPASTNAIIPSAPSKQGTYGRFRYIPNKNAFILVNAVTENVFFYKLADGPGVSLPYPQANFGADATTVEVGTMVTLSWEAQNADQCEASGGWSGVKSLSGSEQVGPIDEDTRFVLTCSSAAGEAVRSILVQTTTLENPPGEENQETQGDTTEETPPDEDPVTGTDGEGSIDTETDTAGDTTHVQDESAITDDALADAQNGSSNPAGSTSPSSDAADSGEEKQRSTVGRGATGPFDLLAGGLAALWGWRRRRRLRASLDRA